MSHLHNRRGVCRQQRFCYNPNDRGTSIGAVLRRDRLEGPTQETQELISFEKEGHVVIVFGDTSSCNGSGKGIRLVALAVLLSFCASVAVPTAWAQGETITPTDPATDAQSTPSGVGMQAAAAVTTILYFPFKAAFAIGGGIVGGLAYLFSGGSEKTAKSIWIPSMYGTYIITPDHLKGDEAVRFLGVPPAGGDALGEAREPASSDTPSRF